MRIDERKLLRARGPLLRLGIDPAASSSAIHAALRSTRTGQYARLLTTRAYKAQLSQARGVYSGVQYLAPEKEAGIAGHSSCHFASPGCASTCIKSTGHMVTAAAARARLKKTLRWFLFEEQTTEDLRFEVEMLEGMSKLKGMDPTARLDGTSDDRFWRRVPWWREVGTRFYDYTKRPVTGMALAAIDDGWHLTFSLSERPESLQQSQRWAEGGTNTALVVAGPIRRSRDLHRRVTHALLERGEFAGRPVLDGDRDDLRYLDPSVGGWVLLASKGGPANRDESGFVVRFDPEVLLGSDLPAEHALLSVSDRARFTRGGHRAAAAK